MDAEHISETDLEKAQLVRGHWEEVKRQEWFDYLETKEEFRPDRSDKIARWEGERRFILRKPIGSPKTSLVRIARVNQKLVEVADYAVKGRSPKGRLILQRINILVGCTAPEMLGFQETILPMLAPYAEGTIRRFLVARCELRADCRVSASELWEAFVEWQGGESDTDRATAWTLTRTDPPSAHVI